MTTRSVPLTEEQYLFIEDLGKELMRAAQHETATKLLAIALAWRVSPEVPDVFACDIDESAGMADLHDLSNYSRKVGTA